MKTVTQWAFVVVVMVGTVACEYSPTRSFPQDAAQQCGPATCPDGCCDDQGACQTASFTTCGVEGGVCTDCSTANSLLVDGCGVDGDCVCLAAGHACLAGWLCGATGCTEEVGPVCDPATQIAPDWGEKDGQCLQSCAALGGNECGAPGCLVGYLATEEPAFDCDVCCVEVPAELEASTTLTVMDISSWVPTTAHSPPQMVNFDVTHELFDVDYPGAVTFGWNPLPGVDAWLPGTAPPITGLIWAFRPLDDAVHYQAQVFDYVTNATTLVSRGGNAPPDVWIGTMLSSLCHHINDTCTAEERTNIVFWSSTTPVAQTGDLIIKPHNVGVLFPNLTQQFTAWMKDSNGVFVDVTNEVSWYIDPAGFPHAGQSIAPGSVATIDGQGLATVQDSWGRVVVGACYPLGCVPTSP